MSPGLLMLLLMNSLLYFPPQTLLLYDSFEDTISTIYVMSNTLKLFSTNVQLDIPAGYFPFGSATFHPALRLL